MVDTALREKYAHRFRVHDADGDGFIGEDDVVRRAERLVAAVGNGSAGRHGEDLVAAARTFRREPAGHAGADPAGRMDETAYVGALERARRAGTIGEVVGPSVRAHVALVDRDGDGRVDLAEFVSAQRAVGQDPATARAAFAALDRDGDGVVTVEEWWRGGGVLHDRRPGGAGQPGPRTP
ncbi:EF-hand domain-containing protein [Streptomyces sp. NPDC089799]|uniref:EF-hand domain-containing protein n=1 Tax=Streptomyces sp. NPDC089799 TaxID=3155066 RepID=UPI003438A853